MLVTAGKESRKSAQRNKNDDHHVKEQEDEKRYVIIESEIFYQMEVQVTIFSTNVSTSVFFSMLFIIQYKNIIENAGNALNITILLNNGTLMLKQGLKSVRIEINKFQKQLNHRIVRNGINILEIFLGSRNISILAKYMLNKTIGSILILL